MASALGNLMANYTDSEGEEGMPGSEDEEEDEINPGLAERLGRIGTSPGNGTPASSASARSGSHNGTPIKKAAKLVSYHDPDAGLSDEERSPVPMELESDAEQENDDQENGDNEDKDVLERSHILEDLWKEGVKLPPEPQGHCSKELQEKIDVAWRKKVEQGVDYNKVIQHKKKFRNPSIYEKLIIHCNIDELGTNFPPNLYDGHLFGKESYYDELQKVQKAEMDKREKALEAKKKAGDGSRLKESQNHNIQHRKSKWDVAGGGGGVPGAIKPGTGPVIPAFGSLNKKK